VRSDLLNGDQIEVGDPLILETHNRYRGDQRVTLARIGRSYLYVSGEYGELPEKFERGTGREAGNRHGYTQQLHTLAQYDEKKLREALVAKLRGLKVDIQYPVQGTIPTSKLKAMLAIMEDTAPSKSRMPRRLHPSRPLRPAHRSSGPWGDTERCAARLVPTNCSLSPAVPGGMTRPSTSTPRSPSASEGRRRRKRAPWRRLSRS